jgi:hypothetical protein
MWWDNGVFPGQPAVDYMFGPLPANLTEVSVAAACSNSSSSSNGRSFQQAWSNITACCVQAWYGKAWAVFGVFMAVPIYYHVNYVDEFRQPFVGEAAARYDNCGPKLRLLGVTGATTIPP